MPNPGESPFRCKRVYAPPEPSDGRRVLVDRLWPRGLSRQTAAIDDWLKEIAPSAALRGWYAHQSRRWPQFRLRYAAELDAKPELVDRLLDMASQGGVTLLFASRDEQRNNAVALKAYLDERLRASDVH